MRRSPSSTPPPYECHKRSVAKSVVRLRPARALCYCNRAVAKRGVGGGDKVTCICQRRLSVAVEPRDPDRLRDVCSQLEKQALVDARYQASEPREVLSYIKDSVAVPHLAALLAANPMLDNLVISGLERVSDDSAVKVLLSHLRSSGDRGELVRAALARIEARTSDSAVRQAVREALIPRF